MTAGVLEIRGRRGIPSRVTLRKADALAAPLEGIALVDEILASVERLQMAVTSRSWTATFGEITRLGRLAIVYRAEFRRLAARIDDPDGRAA